VCASNSAGAYPSPLGYMGFKHSLCTSVNNVMVHGVPSERPLVSGDIMNIDITVYYNGYHGDTSRTVLVGDVDEKGKMLAMYTNEALEMGIAVCKPGVSFAEIGKVIGAHASRYGYSINQSFCGHGIGQYTIYLT
jgi:methionyl aminopeptidase